MSLIVRSLTFHGDVNFLHRHYRLLLELGICAKDLRLYQDRLNVTGRAETKERDIRAKLGYIM